MEMTCLLGPYLVTKIGTKLQCVLCAECVEWTRKFVYICPQCI